MDDDLSLNKIIHQLREGNILPRGEQKREYRTRSQRRNHPTDRIKDKARRKESEAMVDFHIL